MRGQFIDKEKVNELHESGLSVSQIADEIGCHEDTVKKKLRVSHKQYNQVQPPPENVLFDLKVGDKFSAYESEISAARHVYKVVWIGKYTFVGQRVHGYPWRVSFLIKDYGRKSDLAHVKKIQCTS